MKRSCLTLAALGALLLVPAARAVAVPAPAHAQGDVVSSIIPPEYCFAVFGQDYEKFLCSDGSGTH
jgi:hypothetical protein